MKLCKVVHVSSSMTDIFVVNQNKPITNKETGHALFNEMHYLTMFSEE